MDFQGFTTEDFDTFLIDGLDERMAAIQERIQPKFRTIGQALTEDLQMMLGNEMYLHIAKHARRTVNPPKDTWLAICDNKRGYKKHPHFQLGLFDSHLFIWLAYIYELPMKEKIAQTFLTHMDDIYQKIPDHFLVSLDHMEKDATPLQEIDLQKALLRFRDVKKGEFLIGVHLAKNDPILTKPTELYELVKETYRTLLPLYTLSLRN